jgi:hypothetical protein
MAVPHVLAMPDAIAPLAALGARAKPIAMVGPMLAVGYPSVDGLFFDERQWVVAVQDGEFIVTTLGDRAARFDRQRTGVRGNVDITKPRLWLETLR